ncbi:ADP-binding protein [Hartmannibacter diazotrophicus]|uniref:tRNA threonylcarbamoyladenosine biosynthesis protein TsaE n=1 Tax=Hartmannibacter diazotrophicus TaxID=1482074 RepID=A0A2C9D189_9HYPH|nr:tRNA (adenosine(37)-N6)-threonylcarbamoyltransferase complex ATPase subunit type 1 TsaE [Hartmannibacter diazotrophicus]SON53571.1 ADP-binding protein [Hartmannibacter diazotrophicus]
MTRLAGPLRLEGEAATLRLAEDLAAILKPGDCLCLDGDLGAGKTTLARALIRAVAGSPALEVPSPTFTLVQSYETDRLTIHHFDLYRLAGPDELFEIGFDDALRGGVALVEWPERGDGEIPEDALWVRLSIADDPDSREVVIEGLPANLGERLNRSLAVRSLLDRSGLEEATRHWLQGDASSRSYERILTKDRSLVLMNWPEPPRGAPLADGRSYAEVAHIQSSLTSFLAISRTLNERGFVAPQCIAADPANRLLLLSDLGADGIIRDGRPVPERYIAAAELLADLHAETWPETVDLGDCFADGVHQRHAVPPYDREALSVELGLCLDWWFPYAAGRPANEEERQEFWQAWSPLLDRLETAQKSWTLRDFHSPNLLWQEDGEGRRRLGLIDLQDTVFGPAAYDLASLVCDARIDMDAALQQEMLESYFAQHARQGAMLDRSKFMHAYCISVTQRNTKILGGFARLAHRDGKTAYLKHVPRILSYLDTIMQEPILAGLALWYERRLPRP